MSGLDVVVVGATGAVGREMLACLAGSSLGVGRVRALASQRSVGTTVSHGSEELVVAAADGAGLAGADLVFFAADRETSRALAPVALEHGARVIDNSSAYRLEPRVPLVVPEVNGEVLASRPPLVANPNCSTIIALMAVGPLHREFGVTRITAATYQAASGAGAAGLEELELSIARDLAGEEHAPEVFSEPLGFNVIPLIGDLDSRGHSEEEVKMQRESRKILDAPELEVSCTCVRVPVRRSHTVSIVVRMESAVDPLDAARVLREAAGVRVLQERAGDRPPTPLAAAGRDEVLVGRIRRAFSDQQELALVVTGDQLRRGAALNAVRIAERMFAD